MKTIRVRAILLTLILIGTTEAARAAADETPPSSFQVRRLGPRVVDLYGGPGSVKLHTVFVAGRKGLAVVDPGISPRLAEEARRLAAAELGRSDVRTVILTHAHDDHAWGAAAFPGAEIAASRPAAEALKAQAAAPAAALAEELTFSRGKIEDWKAELAAVDPASKDAAAWRTIIAREEALVRDYEAGFAVAIPNLIFDERLTIDLGGLTAELIAYGRAHSDGDILVRIPDEKVVMTGDLAFDFSLGSPDPAAAAPDRAFDVPRWLTALDAVLAGPGRPEFVIASHRREIGTGDELARRRAYLGAVWAAAEASLGRKETPEQLLASGGLEALFPEALAWGLPWSGAISDGERRARHLSLLKLFRREAERLAARRPGLDF